MPVDENRLLLFFFLHTDGERERNAGMSGEKGEIINKEGRDRVRTSVSSSGNSKPSRLTSEQGGPFI